MKLRIAEEQWTALHTGLVERRDVETAGLILAEPIEGGDETILIARRAFVLPEDAYSVRHIDRIEIDPVAINRLTRPARENGWAVLTVHSHPMSTTPWFSAADDAGDARLMPALGHQVPRVPHGSIVVVPSGRAVARFFPPVADATPDRMSIRVIGKRVVSPTEGPTRDDAERWFDRQILALGADGHELLRVLRVAIVGAGGTGSVSAVLLAHLGAGQIVVADGDLVEASNVSRILGARTQDVGRPKVEVIARYIRELGLATHVTPIASAVESEADVAALRGCDVALSCVDRERPRALVNRMAYEAYVPTVDMGTAFRVDESKRIVGDAGRVVVLGPGRPCLACWGDLDPVALRVEALSAEERDRETREGYISGADEPAPSVVAFNAMTASAAVIEVLRMVTGFAGADAAPDRLAFSFAHGTVRRNILAGRSPCSICNA